jgi:hypothetical protein
VSVTIYKNDSDGTEAGTTVRGRWPEELPRTRRQIDPLNAQFLGCVFTGGFLFACFVFALVYQFGR